MANQPYGSSDFDSRQFRTAMGQFCTGVTVISTIDADDKKFIVQLAGIIEENMTDENLSLNFLCDKMCVSRMSLYRKIREITQMTPSEYIRSVKISHATHLLRTTNMTIQEIMFCSGFNNKSYFYREFQKKYGLKPKEYRTKQ